MQALQQFQPVLIVIHLMIVIALVGVVLMQRSEGGGLGIGGGGGFMTARGASNALTRTTGILAAAFFATSLMLGLIARYGASPTDILDRVPQQTQDGQAVPSSGGILDQLGGGDAQAPAGSGASDIPAPAGSGSSDIPAPAEPVQQPAAQDAAPAPDATAPAAAPAQEGSGSAAPATGAPQQGTVPSGQ